jgi:hypothetical protein
MTWSQIARRQTLGGGRLRALLLSLFLVGTLTSTPAHAEVGQEETEPGVKGTVGLAMLGAESVMAIEAAFGLNKWWMYAIGGGAGAIGGGIGGYFIDQSGNAEVSMSLLVGGIVFAVPTTLAILSATAYKPPKNPEIDEQAAVNQRAFARFARVESPGVPSLLDMKGVGSIKFQLPAVAVVPVYSQEMRKVHSLSSAASVRVPLLHLAF